jgi:hypothetical protein
MCGDHPYSPSYRCVLPRIAAKDFESFKSFLKGEIDASTFQEWLELRRKQIACIGVGNIIEQDAGPDEFKRFCHAKTAPHNHQSLLAFAEAKRRREVYP